VIVAHSAENEEIESVGWFHAGGKWDSGRLYQGARRCGAANQPAATQSVPRPIDLPGDLQPFPTRPARIRRREIAASSALSNCGL
jgi:hypothetical protein